MAHRAIRARSTLAVCLVGLVTVGTSLATPRAAADAHTQEVLANGTFDDGHEPWWTTAGLVPDTTAQELCLDVPAGGDPWGAIVGQNELSIQGERDYTLSFTARASVPATIRPLVQPAADPDGTIYFATAQDVGPEPADYAFDFTTPAFDGIVVGQVQLQLGGNPEPYVLCLDDVSLVGPPIVYVPDTGPALKVNQVGYLPNGPKNATWVTTETVTQRWELVDEAGVVLAEGATAPLGVDPSSGENVHAIDFSAHRAASDGLRLRAGSDVSLPFTIGAAIYTPLRAHALEFFYPNRSGIEIDGEIAGAEYARPAGHVGVAPNQGDTAVGCQDPRDYMDFWTCDYTLDVTGGWYDAGDHGKYVVNGGIATYQLLSAWERTLTAEAVVPGALGDGTLRIPEAANGVPDILDEARWNLDFLLKMQVPDGQPLAGMAHHKVHDVAWTGLPLLPSDSDERRALHRPSTAATLNLAAVGAAGARLFGDHDVEFAARLLESARTAYDAAQANPELFAPPEDGAVGGGPYDDDEVADEFYWAAAELYLTTGEDRYLADVLTSPQHEDDIFTPGGFYWGEVGVLGRLSLATVPSGLPDRDRVRESVLDAAELLVASQAGEAFGHPYTPADGRYDWGSNSSILNNQVVLATAFDLSGDPRFARAVLEGMDYLLGRNVLGMSYVTGYGTVYAENQHSRWYARSLDPSLPNPPVGSVSGGPNSSIQDPVAQRWLTGCLPQWCYVDDINAWSVNEITINWNSALSWVASFVADLGDGTVTLDPPPSPSPGPTTGPTPPESSPPSEVEDEVTPRGDESAPTPSGVSAAPGARPGPSSTDTLPVTGADVLPLVVIAVLITGAGAALLVARRSVAPVD